MVFHVTQKVNVPVTVTSMAKIVANVKKDSTISLHVKNVIVIQLVWQLVSRAAVQYQLVNCASAKSE